MENHRVHKTKKNKAKIQNNMCWTPLCKNKNKNKTKQQQQQQQQTNKQTQNNMCWTPLCTNK